MLVALSQRLSPKNVLRHAAKAGAFESKRGWFSQKGIKQKTSQKKTRQEIAESEEADFPSHSPIAHAKNPLNIVALTEVVHVGRHVKITPAGRVYSYSTTLIVGNGNGVGSIGYGKGDSVPTAAEKAYRDAIKRLVPVYRYKDITIPYSMVIDYHGTRVHLAVTTEGGGNKGMMPLLTVADAFGIYGITMKVHRSRNKKNIVRAFVKAVSETTPPEYTARRLGKKLLDINKIWSPAKGLHILFLIIHSLVGDNFFESIHL